VAKPWTLPTFETHGREAKEWEEQADFVRWFRRTYPGVLIFHVPNGAGVSKAMGARLQAMGVVAGVPDLFVPSFHLFVEMKGEKRGATSKAQRELHEQLRADGYSVIVARGSLLAQAAVETFVAVREVTRAIA
jgi:hypothetical protein